MTVIFVKSTPSRNSPIRCKQERVNETEFPLEKKKCLGHEPEAPLYHLHYSFIFFIIFLISTMRRNWSGTTDIGRRSSRDLDSSLARSPRSHDHFLFILFTGVKLMPFLHDVNKTCGKSSNPLRIY